jgi:hypothetical protein
VNAPSSLEEAQARIATLETCLSRMRHDIRGMLTPVLLLADSLHTHSEPVVARKGARIADAVERISTCLDATCQTLPSSSAGT